MPSCRLQYWTCMKEKLSTSPLLSFFTCLSRGRIHDAFLTTHPDLLRVLISEQTRYGLSLLRGLRLRHSSTQLISVAKLRGSVSLRVAILRLVPLIITCLFFIGQIRDRCSFSYPPQGVPGFGFLFRFYWSSPGSVVFLNSEFGSLFQVHDQFRVQLFYFTYCNCVRVQHKPLPNSMYKTNSHPRGTAGAIARGSLSHEDLSGSSSYPC